MRWGLLFATSFIIALIILYDWPKLNKKQKKDKVTFIVMVSIGWLIGVLLIFYPDIPGPTQWVDWLFSPILRFMTK